MPERVVFDTNVWVSGLLWRGKPYQCLLLARAGVVQIVYCDEMAAELSRTLRRVFRFSENHIRAVLYDSHRICSRICRKFRLVSAIPTGWECVAQQSRRILCHVTSILPDPPAPPPAA